MSILKRKGWMRKVGITKKIEQRFGEDGLFLWMIVSGISLICLGLAYIGLVLAYPMFLLALPLVGAWMYYEANKTYVPRKEEEDDWEDD
jgi:hypothetical protein